MDDSEGPPEGDCPTGDILDDFLAQCSGAPARGKWAPGEDEALRAAVEENGAKNWKVIAQSLNTILSKSGATGITERTDVQCLHRWQKVLKPGLVKVRGCCVSPPCPPPPPPLSRTFRDRVLRSSSRRSLNGFVSCISPTPSPCPSALSPLSRSAGSLDARGRRAGPCPRSAARHEEVVSDSSGARGASRKAVPRALVQPPRPSYQAHTVDRGGGPSHHQAAARVREQVGRHRAGRRGTVRVCSRPGRALRYDSTLREPPPPTHTSAFLTLTPRIHTLAPAPQHG